MSVLWLLFNLLALLACAWGVRDEGGEGSVLQVQADKGERQSAIVSATGALHSHGSHKKGASASGTHVCCWSFAKKMKGRTERLTIELDVYHESASKDIAKCQMTLLTGTSCTNQQTCKQECLTKIKASKRYAEFVDREMSARETDEMAAIQKFKAQGQKKYTAELADLDRAYQKEIQAAELAITQAEAAMNAAKQHLEDTLKQYEEIKKEVAEAPVKVENATATYNRTKADFYEAKKTALDNYEQAKALAGNDTNFTREEADRRLLDLQNRSATRKAQVAMLTDSPVPAMCRGDTKKYGPYAAVPCCCSIHGVPIMVDSHFLDWGECKSPKKYERKLLGKLDFAGLTACSAYRECQRCRELVCGKGMCPM